MHRVKLFGQKRLPLILLTHMLGVCKVNPTILQASLEPPREK